MNNGKFSKSIEIWRLLFALSVVLCHAAILPQKPSTFVCTTLGVEFFFLVSGYLMAASAAAKPEPCVLVGEATWNYISKKLEVIFPVFF